MFKTVDKMRSFADAVSDKDGGVTYQPIFPDTLREWANEIENLIVENEILKNMG